MSSIYEKYQKVKALAERGATEGERQAAREALARMEEKYPELARPEVQPGPQPVYIHVIVVKTWSSANTTIWHSGWGGSSTTNI